LNTNLHGTPRGMTLIEVMIALAILGIASLGLAGTLVVSNNSNAIAARRTVMSAFAQARIESLTSTTRTKIPTATSLCCAAMAATNFDPMADPNTGGWILDNIDGPAPATAGDDLLWGPVLVNGSAENGYDAVSKTANGFAATVAKTKSLRTTVLSCADKAVTSDSSVFCREVHIEPYSQSGSPMLRAYVRVIQGGGDWRRSYVLLQQDIAQ
jgi:prepilin-type N-terminal cleavage/methylation domain-containing protein